MLSIRVGSSSVGRLTILVPLGLGQTEARKGVPLDQPTSLRGSWRR